MPILRAEASTVTYGRQSAFGTAATAAGSNRWLGVVRSVDGLFPDLDWKEIRARGADRDVFLYTLGKRTVEGSITLYPQLGNASILQHAYGKVTTTGSSDPFTHTIEGATGVADPGPPITLRRGYQVNSTQEAAFYVRDCIVDSMELSGSEEDILTCTLNILGGKPDPARATESLLSITKDTTQIYPYAKGVFTLDGTVTARIRSFTFRVENNGSMKSYYQSTDADYPFEYVPGPRKYSLEAEVVPVDDTFISKLDAATPTTTANFDIKFTGQTSPERSITINGDVSGGLGVWKSAPFNIPEESEIVVPISMWVNKTTIVALDGNAAAIWDDTP